MIRSKLSRAVAALTLAAALVVPLASPVMAQRYEHRGGNDRGGHDRGRHDRGGWRGHPGPQHYRRGNDWGGYREHDNSGAVIGGALLGLGLGAVIGGALVQPQYAPPAYSAPPPVYYAPPPPAYYAPPPTVYYGYGG